MIKLKKLKVFTFIILSCLLLGIFISFNSIINKNGFNEAISTDITINESNFNGTINDTITSDIYTIYQIKDRASRFYTDDKNPKYIYVPPNKTVSNFNLTLSSIKIEVEELYNDTEYIDIITNTTMIQPTCYTAHSIAQEFTVNRTGRIPYFKIYTNSTSKGWYDAWIYEDLLGEPLHTYPAWANVEIGLSWSYVYFYYVALTPGKYYLVLEPPQGHGITTIGNWAHQNESTQDLDSKIRVGNSWTDIVDDLNNDFFLNYSFQYMPDPDEINLTILIDEVSVPYSKYFLRGMGSPIGWYAGKTIPYPVAPQNEINITVTINETIHNGWIDLELNYFHLANASGTYSVDENTINYTAEYTVFNSTYFDEVFLGFPRDWTVDSVLDIFGNPSDEYALMNFYINQQPYWGLFYPSIGGMGGGAQIPDGDHIVNFLGTNYFSKSQMNKETLNIFAGGQDVYIGDQISFTATLKDSRGNPVTGGNATFYFQTSSGSTIEMTGTFVGNGVFTSPSLDLTGFAEGTYVITIFWTDGTEIGYSSTSIYVSSYTMYYLVFGIVIGASVSALPIGIFARRKLKQRNWEKSLKYLLLLKKDGNNLFGFTFGIELMDTALISGMISAINSFVQEAMKSKKALTNINMEDKKVILSHGEDFLVCLVAEKDLPIIRKRTDLFKQEVEQNYNKIIKNWDGNAKHFKHLDATIMKYYPVSMEERIILGVKEKVLELRELVQTTEDPATLLTLLRQSTSFSVKYTEIINKYYIKEWSDIIKNIEEKMNF